MKSVARHSTNFISSAGGSVIISLLFITVFSAISIALSGHGEWGEFSWSDEERLHLIEGNDFELVGENYNLGYKTRGSYLFSRLGMGIKNNGYVIIPAGSNSSYSSADSETIEMFKSLGLLEDDIPNKPKMSFKVWWAGNLLRIIFGLFCLTIGFSIFHASRKEKKELEKSDKLFEEILEGIPFHDQNILLVMWNAAHADGVIQDEEISTMLEISKHLMKTEISMEKLEELKELPSSVFADSRVKNLHKYGTENDREMLLKAGILIVISDGVITNEEEQFIIKISKYLNISNIKLEDILKQIILSET